MRAERSKWVWAVGAALGVAFGGCGLAQTAPGPDGGTTNGDGGLLGNDGSVAPLDGGPIACGSAICTGGTVCCNASCGLCVPPGGSCPSIECVDAGPAPHYCGGLLDTPCAPNEYCDYPDGAACGATDASGVCRPRPTDCPEPGGVPVCGCDGTTYFGECSAQLAGIDVLHVGACEGPPPRDTVSATASCAPFDGPAWTFVTSSGGPVCGGIPVSASLTIELWAYLETATPGTTYAIDTDFAHDGTATYCPAGGGGPPCLTLRGTMTVDAFVAGSSATFSYALTAADGTSYSGANVPVDVWCSSTRLCG